MSFRAQFEALKHVNIFRETTKWEELEEVFKHGHIDVVAIGLDDANGQGLDVVQRLAQLAPTCGLIGISAKTEPAAIIAAMRAGCSQFVCSPVDVEDLRQAVERIRATRQVSVQNSKRICVIGSSGGSGATTIACNLAMELAHLTDRRIALVDLNLEFGDAASSFDCTPSFNIADVCREGVQIDATLLSKALHELPCNVSVLARPERIEDARDVTAEGLHAMFTAVANLFPYVVVDLPRSVDFLNAAAVTEANRVLIVTQLSIPFLRNATRIHKCLLEMGTEESQIEIVLNRCKSVYERIIPDDVEAHFGRPIFAMIPNDYRRVQSSLDFGHPIVTDAPNTPARLAIQKMARTLAGEAEAATTSNFFNRLWNRNNKEKEKLAQPAGAGSNGGKFP